MEGPVAVHCMRHQPCVWVRSEACHSVLSWMTHAHEVLEVVSVVEAALCLLANVEDGLDSGHWLLPSQGLCSQQDGITAVQDSIGYICCFCPAPLIPMTNIVAPKYRSLSTLLISLGRTLELTGGCWREQQLKRIISIVFLAAKLLPLAPPPQSGFQSGSQRRRPTTLHTEQNLMWKCRHSVASPFGWLGSSCCPGITEVTGQTPFSLRSNVALSCNSSDKACLVSRCLPGRPWSMDHGVHHSCDDDRLAHEIAI